MCNLFYTISLHGTVANPSIIQLVGTRFTSRYRLQAIVCFNDSLSRCKASTPSSLSLTTNKLLTNKLLTNKLLTHCHRQTTLTAKACAQDSKEGNVLFNDALNTFQLRLYGIGHMVKTIQIAREETCCCHYLGYSFRLAARVLFYASSHRQDNIYYSFCYTSHGALARTRNSSAGPPHDGSIRQDSMQTTIYTNR